MDTHKYSNKLNLDEFFYNLSGQIYCVVKKSEDFPNYYKRSDVDIFCYNLPEVSKKILEVGNSYVEEGFRIETVTKKDGVFIDFYYKNELDFRFDLYDDLPKFNEIIIKPSFFACLIENRREEVRKFQGTEFKFFTPSQIDDVLLRYIEYIEWHKIRPDKIKHLDYISSSITNEEDRFVLFERLHYYTDLPRYEYEEDTVYHFGGRYYLKLARAFFEKAKKKQWSELPGAIYRYLKK